MSEQTLQLILMVLLALLGGGGAAGGLYTARTRSSQKAQAKLWEHMFNEANIKLIKAMEMIDGLEKENKAQNDSLAENKARLGILTEERDRERERYQVERDAIMIERGKITSQIEHLIKEVEALRGELKELREKNAELEKDNSKLAEYREIAHEQKRQLDEAAAKQQELTASFRNCQERTRFLESQLEALKEKQVKEETEEPEQRKKAAGE